MTELNEYWTNYHYDLDSDSELIKGSSNYINRWNLLT